MIKKCIFYSSIAIALSSPLIAMEKMPDIENPCCVAFLTKNTIAIGGSSNFILYNTQTKEIIFEKKIDTDDSVCNIISNKSRTAFAVSTFKNASLYNTTTLKKIWSKKTRTYLPSAFNPLNDKELILLSHYKKRLNFYTQSSRNHHPIELHNGTNLLTPLSCHPHKKKILYPIGNYQIAINNYSKGRKTHTISFIPKSTIFQAAYSPNGKCIILNKIANECCCLFDRSITELTHHEFNEKPSIENQPHNPGMTFLTDTILILLRYNNTLEYWNCKKKYLITKTILNDDFFEIYTSIPTPHLALSPDRTHILVALAQKTLLVPVPFDALYKKDTKPSLIIRLLLLKHYEQPFLPNDIIYLIIKNILTLSKRHISS